MGNIGESPKIFGIPQTLRTGKNGESKFGEFRGTSPKNPEIRGWGWGQRFQFLWGYFGDGDNKYFGDFRGQNPQKTSNFGMGTGTRKLGNLQTLVCTNTP